VIWLYYRAVCRGLHSDCGFSRQDIGEKALMARTEVLHEQKDHSRFSWELRQQFRNSFQSSRRSADSDHRERFARGVHQFSLLEKTLDFGHPNQARAVTTEATTFVNGLTVN
jgi:hypothetical protein